MKYRKPKRYVLLESDGALSPSELETLTKVLEQRHGKLAITELKVPRTALIVKTDNVVAAAIRDSCADLRFGDRRVATILTSGNIGKLKRAARRSSAGVVGEIPE